MPRILGVEDDLEFRAPLVKMLTNDGHTVSIAGDGAAAAPDFNLGSAAALGSKVTLAKPFSRADLRRAIQESMAPPLT
jgi:CheY-like chemotaxis protein